VSTRLLLLFSATLGAADIAVDAPALLARRCGSCHNAKAKTSGLDLSSRQTASLGGRRGGGFDELLRRVRQGQMPPDGALDAADQELLSRWVAAGSPWKSAQWWSLRPLQQTPGTIDEFVAARLRDRGLQLAPPAGKRELLRRVTFDLTGLPPTPRDTAAFLADNDSTAYEKVVDRLLASPQYGERWARHWLDVVRFTESEGFERDVPRDHAWPYRDYVIRSLNDDKPYLQFAQEQIAGDILYPTSRDAITATGLLVLGPTDAVGLTSAVEREREAVREDQLEEMAGVVSQTFLGLTVNCARCHDHKFDPIPQVDYYRFKAALSGVWQPFEDPQSTELWPSGRVLDPQYLPRIAALKGKIRDIEIKIKSLHRSPSTRSTPKPTAQWNFDIDGHDSLGDLDAPTLPSTAFSAGHLVTGPSSKSVSLISLPLDRDITEKTLEAWVTIRKPLENLISVFQIYNRSGYRGAASDGIQFAGGTNRQWRNLSTANFRTLDVKGSKEDATPGDSVHIAITYAKDGTIRVFRNGKPYGEPYRPDAGASGGLQTYARGDAVLKFTATADLELNEARLYGQALPAEELAASYAAGPVAAHPAQPGVAALFDQWRTLHKELAGIPAPDRTFAAEPRSPGTTHLLLRGDVNRKANPVSAAGLSALPNAEFGLSPDASDADRRRRLAEWIANPANPLFSRVIVNRVWAHHFGSGIVENPNDFGVNGGLPSHPELLDTLAVDFIRSNWSLKSLHKKLVLSAAYRQSSEFNKNAAAIDAGNRLLWRFAPRRLEGEAIRDAMLAASGKLDPRLGGPSFQPFHITRPGGSYVKYDPFDSDAPDLQRRTIYRMNVNTGGDPMLESMDCPVPAVKTPRRPTTTTALQALSLMNNPLSTRLSKAFADRVAGEEADPNEQVRLAFSLALGRPPSDDELAASLALAKAKGLAALCWGLFNTSEFVHVQ